MADNAAPGRLEIVRSFVNTLDLEDKGKPRDVDPAEDRAAVATWMAENGFISGSLPDAADLDRAIELRESLRSLASTNQQGSDPDLDAVERLNALAAKSPLKVSFGGEGAELVPSGAGVDAALGAILAIVAESMTEGTWSRFKACAKDSCRWAFYDNARNRSGRWCSMETCGNRVKATNYRRKQARPA